MCKDLGIVNKTNQKADLDDMLLDSFNLALNGLIISYQSLKKSADDYISVANDPVKFALNVEDAIVKTEAELGSLFSSIRQSCSVIKDGDKSIFIKTGKEVM